MAAWFQRSVLELLSPPLAERAAGDDDDDDEASAAVCDGASMCVHAELDERQAHLRALRVAESVQTLAVRGMFSWPCTVDMLTECAGLSPPLREAAFGGTTLLLRMLRGARAPERVSGGAAHRVVTALTAVAQLCASGPDERAALHRSNPTVQVRVICVTVGWRCCNGC